MSVFAGMISTLFGAKGDIHEKVVVAALNAKYIHTCLALRYLKSFTEPEFPVTIKEYTIKDPAMNIAMDLYQEAPEVVGFSCYIWNIEETIRVLQILKK